MANIYGGIDLIGGGTGAVDKINGSVLNDKDIFVTIKDGIFYPHWLDDDSSAAENSPLVISPDLNAGTKRWLLAGGVFANIILSDGGTIGQSDGPLLRFDNTNDFLEITGCKVIIGGTIPFAALHIERPSAGVAALDFEDVSQLAIFIPAANTTNYYQPLIGVGENATTFTAAICSFDDGASAAQGLTFHTGDTNAITERVRITSGGKVGIGVDPDRLLHIGGTGIITFKVESTDGQAGIQIDNNATTWDIYMAAGSQDLIFYDTQDRVKFQAGGGVFMYGLKSGTTQGGAGAAVNELWVDTDDDNTIKLGT